MRPGASSSKTSAKNEEGEFSSIHGWSLRTKEQLAVSV